VSARQYARERDRRIGELAAPTPIISTTPNSFWAKCFDCGTKIAPKRGRLASMAGFKERLVFCDTCTNERCKRGSLGS
jgi:hypothetical protein